MRSDLALDWKKQVGAYIVQIGIGQNLDVLCDRYGLTLWLCEYQERFLTGRLDLVTCHLV